MLVEDPVFSGDKSKKEILLYLVSPPAIVLYGGQAGTSIQYHVITVWDNVIFLKLETNFKILAYIDT